MPKKVLATPSTIVATQSYADTSHTSVIFTGYAEDDNPGEGPRIAIEVTPSWHRETDASQSGFRALSFLSAPVCSYQPLVEPINR